VIAAIGPKFQSMGSGTTTQPARKESARPVMPVSDPRPVPWSAAPGSA
jgi:hypothetical protein